MLRKDLEAAGISYEQEGRGFDFPSLRGQFASSLARAGVHPRVAQLLLRHSKADLTLSIYSHLALVDLHGGLEALPAMPVPGKNEPQQAQATGPDGSVGFERTLRASSGGKGNNKSLAPRLAIACRSEETSKGADGEEEEN